MIGPNGEIERAVPISWTVPPHIELSAEGFFVVDADPLGKTGGDERETTPADGLLTGFLELADYCPRSEPSPEGRAAVLAYAKKWGLLTTCAHGFPAVARTFPAVAPTTSSVLQDGKPERYADLLHAADQHRGEARCPPVDSESLAVWFFYARMARGIVRISSYLHGIMNGDPVRPPTSEEAQDLYGEPRDNEPHFMREWVSQSHNIQGTLNQWIALTGLRPVIRWPTLGLPHMRFSTGNHRDGTLFAAITLELIACIVTARGFFVCDGCNKTYVRSGRKPKTGQRNYCQECRDSGIDVRDAQRRKRSNDRAEQMRRAIEKKKGHRR